VVENVITKIERHPRRVAGSVFAASMACLGIGVWLNFYVLIPSGYTRTTGTVSDIKASNVNGRTSLHDSQFAVISFQAGGTSYSFNGDVYDKVPYSVGTPIAVAYFPANPNVAKQVTKASFAGYSFPLFVLGGLGLAGIFMWHFRRWWHAEDIPEDREDKALDKQEAAEQTAQTTQADATVQTENVAVADTMVATVAVAPNTQLQPEPVTDGSYVPPAPPPAEASFYNPAPVIEAAETDEADVPQMPAMEAYAPEQAADDVLAL
jgi:hypothetical protein